MSVNRASTIIGDVSVVIEMQFDRCYVSPTYWLPLQVKEKVTQSLPHSEDGRQWNVNHFGFPSCIISVVTG
jgi:hypothetical protein